MATNTKKVVGYTGPGAIETSISKGGTTDWFMGTDPRATEAGLTSTYGKTSTKKTSTKSPYSTTTGYTAPTTSTRTKDPTVSTSTSKWDPTTDRPIMGDLVRPDLPGAPELPDYMRPELGAVDPYESPEYDEDRIASLTQRAAAPGIRTLRQALREATSRRFDNPNVGALTVSKALQGYGTGLENIMGGAAKTAGEQYGREYGAKTEEAKINYTTAVNDRNAIFNADMHSNDANFQAAIKNIEMVYGAEVAAEMQATADQNAQNRDIFSAAINEYLQTGTRTDTTTTTGGKETVTTSGGQKTVSEGPYNKNAISEGKVQTLTDTYNANPTSASWLAIKKAERDAAYKAAISRSTGTRHQRV